MQQTKRHDNEMVQISDSHKKRKLENQIPTMNSNKYCLEDLTNEILYEIFEYVNVYDIYKGFYNLNKRFQDLAIHANVLTKINFSTMSKSNFKDYYRNILMPNRNRINFLRLSNPFIAEIIFSRPRLVFNFIHLETLVLENIQIKYLYKILDNLVHLQPLFTALIEDDYSPMQSLIINGRFPFDSFGHLLYCLPKLQHLSIDCLVQQRFDTEEEELSLIQLKYLKYVSLHIDHIEFTKFKKIIRKVFHYVQTLRLTTYHDAAYLNAKHWQKLIVTYMPYLRIFDINHEGSVKTNTLTYHDIINEFNSSFWIKNRWRKDYIYYWESNESICSQIQKENYDSVKHLYICSEEIKDNYLNYFPNVNQLTIKHRFETSDDSIPTTLHCMIPLKQLTKLVIECYKFSFIEIFQLLYLTPNLYALKLDHLFFSDINLNVIKENEVFQYVSNTNKIKIVDFGVWCSLNEIQLIVNLFSQLEYLKIGMNKKEIQSIVRFLLLKTNDKTQHLFFLCILRIPKICLKKLNVLTRSENLLHDYCSKFINCDLCLWW
ncbi:unnamed protein product [Rotaria sordida]|uniref:F-box domain-containing protein n=1 Tax=Rotaria sordida TaxID=392033 RepID=A0A816C8Z9_9BILA|nr:unnamed protein product [Rotaria sordida]